ncbi:hypothetical protein KBD09_02140 [Candidatus Woesebacteria bacterium]|nr:hypothetical protein [Candidatus Woesebacteria bacterium]
MDVAKALKRGETAMFKITDAANPDEVYAEAQALMDEGFDVDVEDADDYEIEVTGR